MQCRRLDDGVDDACSAQSGKTRIFRQFRCQDTDVALGAANMVAGFVVTCFGQTGQGAHRDILHDLVVAHALRHFRLQPGILVAQEVACRLEFQLRAHARQHYRRPDWFVDVVDSTQCEAQFLVGIGIHGGHENHRNIARRRSGTQFVEHGVAIQVGHHDIKQYQVGAGQRGGNRERPCSRIGDSDKILVLQEITQHRQIFGYVIHHQNYRLVGRIVHG